MYSSESSSVNVKISYIIAITNILFKYIQKCKGPLTYYLAQGEHGAIHILPSTRGLLIFVTKCGRGWVGCFQSVMSHFLNNWILSIFEFKIAWPFCRTNLPPRLK